MNLTELRPLSLGELLDRTFSSYRQHFWSFVGIMAIPQLILVALQLMQQTLLRPFMTARSAIGAFNVTLIAGMVGGSLIVMALYGLVYSAALGATTLAVSEFYLGRSITIGQAYGRLRGRFWKLIATMTLQVLCGLGLFAVPVAIFAMMIAVMPHRNEGTATVVIVGVIFALASIGAGIAAVMLALRLALSVPALVLENVSPVDAIKRSFKLTKGYTGRIFVIGLLVGLIAMIAVVVFQMPFIIATILVAVKHGVVAFWLTSAMTVSQGIGVTLSAPLGLIAMALAYYDTRVRNEGLDLQLMMSALGESAPPGTQPGSPAPV